MTDDPLFRRIRQHADKRLRFHEHSSRLERVDKLREYLRLEREMLLRYHLKGDSGLRVTRARTIIVDVLLQHLFDFALSTAARSQQQPPSRVALVALGGYGRCELSPLSDIDVMFLFAKPQSGQLQPIQATFTDEILYPMWDLGLKVGYSSRTIKEAIQEASAEDKSLNAMLEARHVCGDQSLFDEFQRSFERYFKSIDSKNYFNHRLGNQRERRAKHGNTVYLQEPEIKNGVGGLRDYQNILWMAKFRFGKADLESLEKKKFLQPSDTRALLNAYDYLLRVRNELHFTSRRATDLLDLERQPKIAWALGYKQQDIFERVETFMRDYYEAAQTIFTTTRLLERQLANELPKRSTPLTFQAVIDSRRVDRQRFIDGFMITPGEISMIETGAFATNPERLIRVFRYMQQFEAEPDLRLQIAIRESAHLITPEVVGSPNANKTFRSILQSSGQVFSTLSKMHELRVLGRFIPEFGRLTCMVQHEYYHRYTADIHTLATIEHADRVLTDASKESIAYGRILRATEVPNLIYLMLLLHDIGKAVSIKNHARIGREIADPILQRLGVEDRFHKHVLFIIENHLEMARFWQHYDLDDPRTAQSFAEFVGDTDTLRYLCVLTYCDAHGTAEGLWNGYKDSLHQTLFRKAIEILEEDKSVIEQRNRQQILMIKKEVLERTRGRLPTDQIEAHFNLLPERYFIQHSADEIIKHMEMIESLLENITNADSLGSLMPVVDWHDDPDQGMSVVNIVTWDRAGLFYKLAGALTVAGVSILSTKAISRSDHITIDTFYVTEPGGGIVQSPKTRETFQKHLEETLLFNKDLLQQINDRARRNIAENVLRRRDRLEAPIRPQVEVYHELSLRRTIVEVHASDHLGLLYQLARAIYENGFDITFARIATERGVAIDTFYIEPIDEKTAVPSNALVDLREALIEITSDDDIQMAS